MKYNIETMKEIVSEYMIGGKILDWGCGDLKVASQLFPQSEITGVELSKEILDKAKKTARENNIKFSPILFENRSAIKDKFDNATAIALLELLDKEQARIIFGEIRDHLKDRGRVFVTFHPYNIWNAVYITHLFKKNAYQKYVNKSGWTPTREKPNEIIKNLEEIGFKVLEYGAFNPYPIKLSFLAIRPFYKTKKFAINWYATKYLVLEKIS